MSMEAIDSYIKMNPVEGIIVMGRFSNEILQFLKEKFKNIIYAGANYIGAGFDEVICDSYQCVFSVIEHLVSCGYKKIGYLGEFNLKDMHGTGEGVVNEHRYEAYKDAIEKYGIELCDSYIIESRLNSKSAYQRMVRYLDENERESLPEVIVCANDTSAIGAMKAIKEYGLKIPKDIAITGIDDIESSSFVSPPLTTVKIPKVELGKTAVKIIG